MTKTSEPKTTVNRFYETVSLGEEGGMFCLHLDGKNAKTPKRHLLATKYRPLAEQIVKEWDAITEEINFQAMAFTRLLSTAIDLGSDERDAWENIVVDYLKADLLCHRAELPAALVERQCEVWDPYLSFILKKFGADPSITAGIATVTHPPALLEAFATYLKELSIEALLGVKCAAENSGSAMLAVALFDSFATVDEIFDASRLDEHFQEEKWGVDAEAKAREQILRNEFYSIDRFLLMTAVQK